MNENINYVDSLSKIQGISKKLNEDNGATAVIVNDFGEYNWSIRLHIPTIFTDKPYFVLFDNIEEGNPLLTKSNKCARISICDPSYIYCDDCFKNNWILNANEKKHLCELLSKDNTWYMMMCIYEDQAEGYYDISLTDTIMPDYMQLPDYTLL